MEIMTLPDSPRSLLELRDIYTESTDGKPALLKLYRKGQSSQPILNSFIHPGLDSIFRVDLYDVVKSMANPVLPKEEIQLPLDFDLMEGVSAELTLEIGAKKATFTALLYDDIGFNFLSDADRINVPADGEISLTIPDNPDVKKIYCVLPGNVKKVLWSAPVISIFSPERFWGATFSIALLGIKSGTFYFTAESADGVVAYQSPYYTITPGDWQDYMFYSGYGMYEYMPMSGRLELAPKFKFNNIPVTSGVRKISMSKEQVFTQESGPLTEATYENLLELLESDFIYHEGRKIIILDVDTTFSQSDDYWHVSFQFRYERPASEERASNFITRDWKYIITSDNKIFKSK